MKRYLNVASLWLMVVASANAQSQYRKYSTLEITAKQPQFALGSDVNVLVVFKNISEQTIDCSTSSGGFGRDYSFNYDIKDASGDPVTLVLHNHPELESNDFKPCSMPQGSSMVLDIDLSRTFSFNHPGAYTLQLSRSATGEIADGNVTSNVLTITVASPVAPELADR